MSTYDDGYWQILFAFEAPLLLLRSLPAHMYPPLALVAGSILIVITKVVISKSTNLKLTRLEAAIARLEAEDIRLRHHVQFNNLTRGNLVY